MKQIRIIFILLISQICILNLFSEDILLKVLNEELKRDFNQLENHNPKPYYLEYRVDDIKSYSISTSFGSLVNDDEARSRFLSVTTRIGSPQLDNSHEINKTTSPFQPVTIGLPIEDNPDALKMLIWQSTHYSVMNSIDDYNMVMSSLKQNNKKNNEENIVPDFSIEKPYTYYEEPIDLTLPDKSKWVQKLKDITSQFRQDTTVVRADASLYYYGIRKYFVNSEGSSIVQNNTYAQLQIWVVVRSSNGNYYPIVKSYYSYYTDSLVSDNQLNNDISWIKTMVSKLYNAPLAEAYSGPAILSPSAAAVFFHEIFGHRIEGHRLKSISDSHTFINQIGNKILPKQISIYCDPTLQKINNQDLFGYYKYDDEGMQAQRVDIVNQGKLVGFLMSRSPNKILSHSNGHGRSQIGRVPVSRQSNFIVTTSKPYSDKELRKKLISECKKQKKQYGLYIEQVIGGFTQTSRYSPNVFNITPVLVYKIYTDGRPDELVTGIDLIGTPLAIFSEIVATGSELEVFNGYCGAESGSIPVSAVSPALFIKKIEIQKKPDNSSSIPILPSPDIEKK